MATDSTVTMLGRRYDAFISYRHVARDSAIAVAIQSGLHRVNRPLFRRRALDVFLDNATLPPGEDLPGRIGDAIDNARFFILVASPDSAKAHWVNLEVERRLQRRGTSGLIIVLATGRLTWSSSAARFDPTLTDAIPPSLVQAYSVEPKWVDMTWVSDRGQELSARHAMFADRLLDIAAPLHGMTKNDLGGADVARQRRVRLISGLGVILIAMLASAATVAAYNFYLQRNLAEARLRESVARQLVAKGQALESGDPTRIADTLRLDATAMHLHDEATTETATRHSMELLPPRLARLEADEPFAIEAVAISADGTKVLTAGRQGGVAIRSTSDLTEVRAIAVPPFARAMADPSGRGIVLQDASGSLSRLSFDPEAGAWQLAAPTVRAPGQLLAVSSGGAYAAVAAGPRDLAVVRLADGAIGGRLGLEDMVERLRAVALAMGGDQLAYSFDHQTVGLDAEVHWSRLGKDSTKKLLHLPEIARALQFSPDGQMLLAADRRMIRRWRLPDLALDTDIEVAGPGVSSVVFSPSGRFLAVGLSGSAASIVDSALRQEVARITHDDRIDGLAFDDAERTIATHGVASVPTANRLDASVATWRIADAPAFERATLLRAGTSAVADFALSPDGRRLASADEGVLQVRDLATGRQLATREQFDRDLLGAGLSFDTTGATLLAFSQDHPIAAFAADTLQPLRRFGWLPATVNEHRVDARRRWLAWYAAGDGPDAVRILDLATGRVVRELATDSWFYGMALNPRSDIIAYSRRLEDRENHRLAVVNITSGAESMIKDSETPWRELAYIADGELLATSAEHEIVALDQAGASRLRTTTSAFVEALAAPPKGEVLAYVGDDNLVRILDATDFQELARLPFQAHHSTQRVRQLEFSPDGAWLYLRIVGEPWIWRWRWNRDLVLPEACARIGIGLDEPGWRREVAYLPFEAWCPPPP